MMVTKEAMGKKIEILLKDGRDVLAEMKDEDQLKHIPVPVLTTSNAEKHILETYDLRTSCYITTPVDFAQFVAVVKLIENFWFGIVKLSKGTEADVQL